MNGTDEDGAFALTRRGLLRGTLGAGAALTLPSWLAACGSSGAVGSSTSGAPSGSSAGTSTIAAGTPRRGGRLVVALHDGGAQDTLAPWNIPTYSGDARAEQVFERLFKFDPAGKPSPRLATGVQSNADATVWRATLRSGVTFHDGKTMTADDVLYSLRYVADPKNKAESLPRLEPLNLATSRAISPTEIEFRLNRPIGDFAGLLAEKALWIVPAGTTDFSKPNGTGPFMFVQWQPGVRALYRRNPHYWGIGEHGGPWVDELEIQIVPDQTARLNALLGGQVQEITYIDFVSARAQQSNSAIQIIRTRQPNTTPIYMQIDAPTFRDLRVRHAMKMAIDREALVKNVLLGYGSIGNDLFGKGQPSYNSEIPQRPYDPQQAASLLKAAGVGGLRLTLPTSSATPGMLESATAFKQQAKAAGIDITLQKLPAESYFTNKQYLKVPFYQTNWGQGFESQAQDGLLKNAPYNETHWYDSSWEGQFRQAQAIADPDRRNAAYKALQPALWDRGGYIVWATFDTLDAASSKVRGIVPNISSGFQNLGSFEFKDHWLEA